MLICAVYTELNGALPLYLSARGHWNKHTGRSLLVWALAIVGNLAGGITMAAFLKACYIFNQPAKAALRSIVHAKYYKFHHSGAEGWFALIASGMLANFLVAAASYAAKEGRTVVDKITALALPLFVFGCLGAAHSVANMCWFAIVLIEDRHTAEVTWGEAWANFFVSGIGNVLGSIVFQAVPQFIGHGLTPHFHRKFG